MPDGRRPQAAAPSRLMGAGSAIRNGRLCRNITGVTAGRQGPERMLHRCPGLRPGECSGHDPSRRSAACVVLGVVLDRLILPSLPTLQGEHVVLRGHLESDVDDRLRHAARSIAIGPAVSVRRGSAVKPGCTQTAGKTSSSWEYCSPSTFPSRRLPARRNPIPQDPLNSYRPSHAWKARGQLSPVKGSAQSNHLGRERMSVTPRHQPPQSLRAPEPPNGRSR